MYDKVLTTGSRRSQFIRRISAFAISEYYSEKTPVHKDYGKSILILYFSFNQLVNSRESWVLVSRRLESRDPFFNVLLFVWKLRVLVRGVARNLIWVGISEFVLGQGDKTTS